MVKKYGRLLLLVFSLFLLPMPTVSAAPNVMDEFTPESDLPETSAPVVRYNEFPIDHYQMDVYMKNKKKEEGFWSSMNPFQVDDKIMDSISTFQHQTLNGIWYGYIVLVNAGIYVMEQAFTFDLIGSMLGHVATFISEIGGPYGMGQFMSFILILTAGWLVYVFVKRQFRHAFGGLIIAAVLSGVFTLYIQNSETLLGWMNDTRNQLSNSVLNASTYNLDTSGEEQIKTDNEKYDGDITDDNTVRYGLSRIRNLMHDLLIVKPYLLLEFGSTNLAVIGGAQNQNDYTQANIQAGKDKVKILLKAKLGSAEREKFIKDNKANSMFAVDKMSQRIVLALLVFIPAIAILGMTGFMAVLVQVYGIAFLITASIGVFILMLSIFPALRSFAFQWVGRLLRFLLMSVAFTFGLVLMFSFVNIIYKVAEKNNWNYVQIIIAVLIVVATMVFLNKLLWGYKVMKQNMDRIKAHTQSQVDAITERRRIRQEQEEFATSGGYRSPGMQPVARRGYQDRATSRIMEAMQRQHAQSEHGPIKSNGKNTDPAIARTIQQANAKKDDKGGVLKKQPQSEEKAENPNSNLAVMNQIQKQQGNEPERIKKQPGGEENTQNPAVASDQGSGRSNQDEMKKIQKQQAQEFTRIKKQPQTPEQLKPEREPSTSKGQNHQELQKLKRAEAKDKQEQGSLQSKNIITFPTRQDQVAQEQEVQRQQQFNEHMKARRESAAASNEDEIKNRSQDRQIEQIQKQQSKQDNKG
ncbi:CD3337/EF1877 family mobilome membrane protein [Peribacillus castrilensis]|uniref:CD3337/EF1877 family mobilome membrane protein n=1 Tax=Bacillaceae TaxID=186817 RepID=UPI000661358A|nr:MULTISPECIES: type IV secretion system protein [Bacillaceae]PRA81588.1 hypothetical protein CQ056_20530 [Peribacillus simplex]